MEKDKNLTCALFVSCHCGRATWRDGLCIYHHPQCVKDPQCRKKLTFQHNCVGCKLPGGEAVDTPLVLSNSKIYGPLIVDTVSGDIELNGVRGVELYVHNVRGRILARSSKFRHVYIDRIVGEIDLSRGKFQSLIILSAEGGITLTKTKVSGHIYIAESKGVLTSTKITAAGDLTIEKYIGNVLINGVVNSVRFWKVRGGVDLSNIKTEEIYFVECEIDRLDLTDTEINRQLIAVSSKFAGMRINKREMFTKIKIL